MSELQAFEYMLYMSTIEFCIFLDTRNTTKFEDEILFAFEALLAMAED